jgi:cell division protein FtsQ
LSARFRPGGSSHRGPGNFSQTLREFERRLPRSAELLLLLFFFAATGIYGIWRGGETAALIDAVRDAGDTVATAAGFGIDEVEIAGARQISRAEVLASANIKPTTSLLLLDPEATRARLRQNPWIAEATVKKLYPGRLEIAVKEREGFAVWQRNGRLSVIARDGTVIGADAQVHLRQFPLVVGAGAEQRGVDFLALVDRFPEIRAAFAAAVLVAERRWNIRLKSGTDVKLPAEGVEAALAALVVLDRESKVLTRDVTVIDLRVPGRVTVQLSEEAAKTRAPKRRESGT